MFTSSPQKRGGNKLISLEGISGCGKTYLLRKVQPELLNDVFLSEISERTAEGMDTKILAALRSTNDEFFRTGHPCTETLLVLALRAFDYEQRIATALASGLTVWEDRSVDTIAVYQSILLNPENEGRWLDAALRLLDIASQFRPVPDLTFLIDDDFERSLARAENREHVSYSASAKALLSAAHRLYPKLANAFPQRFVLIDRREMDEEFIKEALLSKDAPGHGTG